jgi:phosphoribosyl 1,2-cyclic phosphodiesterase
MPNREQQIAFAGVAAVAAAAAFLLHRRRHRRAPPSDAPGLIFTGTGCSSGLPLTGCTLGQEWAPKDCHACRPALRHGQADPNWRGNVSALLRFKDAAGRLRLVQIDCGKTYREITAMRVYRQHGVKAIDALLLTHDHADALGGLDELRSLQPYDAVTMEVGTAIRCAVLRARVGLG